MIEIGPVLGVSQGTSILIPWQSYIINSNILIAKRGQSVGPEDPGLCIIIKTYTALIARRVQRLIQPSQTLGSFERHLFLARQTMKTSLGR